MAIELAAIRRSVHDAAQRDISFGVMGIGKEPVQRHISTLVETAPEAILVVGFCGAADPQLKPGDLHIAQSFLHPDMPDDIDSDSRLRALLAHAGEQAGARVATGTSATVKAVAGPGSKSRLHVATGSASVNMEDYWAARAARDAGIPFASVRAVIDSASVEIPGYLSGGPSNPGRILWGLTLHPGRLPTLIRFARAARAARTGLTRCVISAIEILAPAHPVLSAVPE